MKGIQTAALRLFRKILEDLRGKYESHRDAELCKTLLTTICSVLSPKYTVMFAKICQKRKHDMRDPSWPEYIVGQVNPLFKEEVKPLFQAPTGIGPTSTRHIDTHTKDAPSQLSQGCQNVYQAGLASVTQPREKLSHETNPRVLLKKIRNIGNKRFNEFIHFMPSLSKNSSQKRMGSVSSRIVTQGRNASLGYVETTSISNKS
ncbi:unnamed protein product [Lepeophtheirus salmonis]|uniref:(salmon louse) hypothetical protein n=1 Tax=Lepeophtheirus salmonis TaxID=72036 RepID=A0A7R8D0C6_LEPSM|nr:unnamed protein product [Lepeophtheirus salmonis]CAF2982171.1 unnamed protein product [Lepeophtheirus salmonis]